jgi:CRP/FNR family transcriptional regulator, cyclic AMP receptor protein
MPPVSGSVVRNEALAAGGENGDSFSSAVGPDLAAEFARRGFPRSYSRGQTLFHEGQAADSVFLIRRGHIKVMTTTSNGHEVVLAFRGPGDLVGEQSVLDG